MQITFGFDKDEVCDEAIGHIVRRINMKTSLKVVDWHVKKMLDPDCPRMLRMELEPKLPECFTRTNYGTKEADVVALVFHEFSKAHDRLTKVVTDATKPMDEFVTHMYEKTLGAATSIAIFDIGTAVRDEVLAEGWEWLGLRASPYMNEGRELCYRVVFNVGIPSSLCQSQAASDLEDIVECKVEAAHAALSVPDLFGQGDVQFKSRRNEADDFVDALKYAMSAPSFGVASSGGIDADTLAYHVKCKLVAALDEIDLTPLEIEDIRNAFIEAMNEVTLR